MLAVGVLCLWLAGCTKNSADEIVVGGHLVRQRHRHLWESSNAGVQLAAEEINASEDLLGKSSASSSRTIRASRRRHARRAQALKQNEVVAVLGEVASSRSLRGARMPARRRADDLPASTNPKVTAVGDYISASASSIRSGVDHGEVRSRDAQGQTAAILRDIQERLQRRPGGLLP
jgi:hypothetical protein